MKCKQLLIIVLCLSFCASIPKVYAQTDFTVQGVVTEAETGFPLPGVNITVRGEPARGTVTNIDGEYTLRVSSPNDVLIFSYIGFLTMEIPINGRNQIDIAMVTDVTALEELIVIGYGVQERGDNTGSISVVSSRDFNLGAITSPEELFQGRAAGVNVTSNSGAPGAGATIRIRGGSSLSASNDPLFVVDGFPLDDADISGMRNPLNTINPNDIESITILKDASAAAIYGSRASNGVIIITTKRGAAEQPLQVNYTGSYSYQTNQNRVDVLSVEEFREIVGSLGTGPAQLLGNENTNWQDQIFRNTFSQDQNLSFTGSARSLPYRASLGFSGNQGVLKTSDSNRFTGTVAVNPAFLDNQLRMDVSLRAMQERNRFADQGAIATAMRFDPTQPVRIGGDDAPYGGYYAWTTPQGTLLGLAPNNPVAVLDQRSDKSQVNRLIGNLSVEYDMPFLPELTATLNLGFDYSDVADGRVRVSELAAFQDAGAAKGLRRDYTQRKENEVLDFYLFYKTSLPEIRSDIDITAGYSWEHHYEKGSTYETNANISETLVVQQDTRYATEHYIVSFFGRANYSLLNKYLFTATLRQDGTSRFSSDNRWGLFPSFAFAWKMHEEPFFRNVSAINELKLRLGYGVTGQQRIGMGDYPYLARYTYSEPTAQYQFDDEFIITLRPEGYNINLKWEETTTYNIGLDYSLFGDKMFGSIEGYFRRTDDLLNVVPVAAGTNFTNRILSNVGTLEVYGVEFSIATRLITKENVLWQVGFNTSWNMDEITKLTIVDDPAFVGVETGGIAGGVGNYIQMHSVGYPRNSFFVFEQVYDQNGRPVEGVYVDRNGDGIINTSDMYRYKSPTPDMTFGLSSRFEYKNWDAGFSARASIGNYVYNNVASNYGSINDMFHATGFLVNVSRSALDTGFRSPRYMSDYYVENASFLRLDNVGVGYTFQDLFETVSSLRISATLQNAFVITKYSGQDPEVVGGIDYDLYPRPTTFVLGVSLNF